MSSICCWEIKCNAMRHHRTLDLVVSSLKPLKFMKTPPPSPPQTTRGGYKVFQYGFKQETKARLLKEARKGLSLLQCLWNVGRLQRRIFNGVGKLYVSLQLYCWAILWGYLWRHISYHGNAQGPQKRPLNFSFCKLSEKLIRWPTIFISLLESSLNSLTFQTVWKKFI